MWTTYRLIQYYKYFQLVWVVLKFCMISIVFVYGFHLCLRERYVNTFAPRIAFRRGASRDVVEICFWCFFVTQRFSSVVIGNWIVWALTKVIKERQTQTLYCICTWFSLRIGLSWIIMRNDLHVTNHHF